MFALTLAAADLLLVKGKARAHFVLFLRTRPTYSPARERCSSIPSSGFEIFVPGRQDDPVYRSADLFERTVSHFLPRCGVLPSIETMERRDSVVLLENRCLGGDLRCVEVDLFWVLLGFNLDEAAFNRLFHGFGKIA